MKRWLLSCLVAMVAVSTSDAQAGRIFVTGHDPIWHSNFGANAVGAANIATAGIDFAVGGSALPFLFVESKTVPVPGGNAHTEPFLGGLGYAGYTHNDAADLAGAGDFATYLSNFSAIVMPSDHGGMLSADELQFMNDQSAVILNFLNAGGGLFAAAQSNATGMLGTTARYGFLPFLVASVDFGAAETANTVTAAGAGAPFNLADADVNGNFSHSFFSSTGGMDPLDLFNGDPDRPLTLAFDGQIGVTGVPGPAPVFLFLTALLMLIRVSRR